jgi:geranylgeranyl reductase family protein
MKREIIIAGAGPTGATAAIALSRLGHDVLLIDRQAFPRDKPCGDGIPTRAVEILYELGLKDCFDQAEFHPIDRIGFVSPAGYIYENQMKKGRQAAQPYIIPRLQFDAILQKKAVQAGAEFCQASIKEPVVEAEQVKGVRVQGDGCTQEIHAKLVLAADGATSVIRRVLSSQQPSEAPSEAHRAVALRVYTEDLEVKPHQVEFFFHKDILPGYAWIFPLGAHKANVGVGMRLDKFRQQHLSLQEMLERFLQLPFIRERFRPGGHLSHEATWQLTLGSQKHVRRAFAGAMLLGDAGWMIDPLTGGGIENGMISAQLAAQTAHHALQQGDCSLHMLRPYEQACQATLWPTMRRSFFIQRIILHYPHLLDWVIKYARNHSHLTEVFLGKL